MIDNPLLSEAARALLASRAERAAQSGPVRRPRSGDAPLAIPQLAQWLLTQVYATAHRATLPKRLRLRGRLDQPALQRALDEIIRRHEVLRSVFVMEGGEPLQRITAPGPVPIQMVDLRQRPDDVRAAEAAEFLERDAARPFDLATDLLLRALLVRLGEDEHELQITVHPIVFDGWSTGLLLHELGILYSAFREGRPSPLGEPALQYADFAEWQRAHEAAGGQHADAQFWRERLAGSTSILDLPLDRPRPPERQFRVARASHTVPAALCERLEAIALEERVTLSALALAAFQVLVARRTGQEDFVFGAVTANRQHAATEDLIGCFMALIPVRASLADAPAFRAHLQRTAEFMTASWGHQSYPFNSLMAELRPGKDLRSSPLFQVAFNYRNMRIALPQMAGLEASDFRSPHMSSTFDLHMNVTPGDQGLTLELEYDPDLFDADTASRWNAGYATLLAAIADDPGASVGDLNILPADERRLLVAEFSGAGAPPSSRAPRTIPGWFREQAARTPDAVAITDGSRQVTYAELQRRAGRAAARLRAAGITRGQVVGVLVPPSAELVAALLAILETGAAYLPIDAWSPAERRAFMLGDAGAAALITGGSEPMPGCPVPVMPCADLFADGPVWSPSDGPKPDDPAYIIYTSGSTGRPKGVRVTHANVSRLFTSTETDFRFGSADVWTLFHSAAFDFSVWEMWGALLYGGRLVVVPQDVTRAPEQFRALLARERVTVLNQTPLAWRQLMAADDASGDRLGLRLVILGGDTLDPQSLAGWFARYGDEQPAIVNMYGITETTVHVTRRRIRKGDLTGGSVIGRPIPDLQVFVLDSRARPVPVGVAGELYVGGAGLAKGYVNRPELDAERFITASAPGLPAIRLYRTGDRVRFLGNGDLEFLGRMDFQVKVRGFRVELGEIETALSQIPGIANAAVVLQPDPAGDPRLVAYWVQRREAPEPGSLREALGHRLPGYMLPAVFVRIDSLPRTSNGKVDRRALTMFRQADTVSLSPPATPTERTIAQVWRDVLGVAGVGRDSRFLDLGGHSLVAVRVASRLRTLFPVHISVRTVLEHDVLSALAAEVDRLVAAGGAQPAESAPEAALPAPTRRADRTRAPATAEQRLLWEIERTAPGMTAYNVPILRRIEGPIEAEALERALEDLAARHEACRTTFTEENGQVIQRFAAQATWPLEILDFRSHPGDLRAEASWQAVVERSERPFDLARGPLCRAFLARLTDQESLLLLCLHHIAVDGVSVSVLLEDLGQAYQARLEGRAPLPSPADVEFGDYAAWLNHSSQGAVREGHLQFWREQLAGADLSVTLPTDRSRPARPTFQGHTVRDTADLELRNALEGIARKHHTTLNVVLLAAWRILLFRLSEQEDLTIGTVLAGREVPQVERTVGYFARTVLARSVVTDGSTLDEVLQTVRASIIGALEHPVSLEDILDVIRSREDWGFRLIFTYNEEPRDPEMLGNATLRPIALTARGAKADLSLTVTRGNTGLEIALHAANDLYDPETTARCLGLYRTLLEGIAGGAAGAVTSLPWMRATDHAEVLELGRGPVRRLSRRSSVAEQFLEQAARTPAAIALSDGERRWSFAELADRATALAAALAERSLGRGDRIAIVARRSLETIMGMAAAAIAGVAYVPIDPEQPEERVHSILLDAGVKLSLVDGAGSTAVGTSTPTHDLGELPAPGAARLLVPRGKPEDAAYVIYTSGSTGQPKGVLVSHRALLNHMDWVLQEYPLTEQDVLLQRSPLGFDASIWEVWAPLMAGCRMALASHDRHFDPVYLHETLQREGVTEVQLVPSTLELMLEAGSFADCPALRRVFSGGEALTADQVRRFHAAHPAELINCYGPTEVTIDATVWRSDRAARRQVIPIGRSLHNLSAYVLDRRRQLAPIGVPGELYLGGVGVAIGYLNRPELTAERFMPDPFSRDRDARMYRTGDRVRLRADGNLEYMGRVDNQIKFHGVRIEPGEIEAVLADHPGVRDVAAGIARDSRGDARLVAWVIRSPESAVTADTIRRAFVAALPGPLVPSVVMFLEEFPRTASGKLDRRALPTPPDPVSRHVPPDSPMQITVAAIWADVFGRDQVGRDDELFALGGHSLTAIRIANRLRAVTGLDVTLRTVLEYSTVASLARELENLASAGAPPAPAQVIAAMPRRTRPAAARRPRE